MAAIIATIPILIPSSFPPPSLAPPVRRDQPRRPTNSTAGVSACQSRFTIASSPRRPPARLPAGRNDEPTAGVVESVRTTGRGGARGYDAGETEEARTVMGGLPGYRSRYPVPPIRDPSSLRPRFRGWPGRDRRGLPTTNPWILSPSARPRWHARVHRRIGIESNDNNLTASRTSSELIPASMSLPPTSAELTVQILAFSTTSATASPPGSSFSRASTAEASRTADIANRLSRLADAVRRSVRQQGFCRRARWREPVRERASAPALETISATRRRSGEQRPALRNSNPWRRVFRPAPVFDRSNPHEDRM